jgi:uncharacterized protein YqeY
MLEETISNDLKQALKNGEKDRVSALRMVISEIKNKKIADRTDDLEDGKIAGLLQKMVRQHKESIKQFREGKREDLVEKESAELAVLEAYLPEQMSEDELVGIVSETISELGATSAKDTGKVMKAVMNKVQGKADGKLVSGIVKEKLSG